MNAVRNVLRKKDDNGQSEPFGREGFLLTSTSANEA